MPKYRRPFIQILSEVIASMVATIQVTSVVLNGDGSQTLSCCDIFYAQKKFNVTINSLSYKITAVSFTDSTITVMPNFTGVSTIAPKTIFTLYQVYFFHGTPAATQEELVKIKNENNKTPMIWLWENYKESIFEFEMIERRISVELYALTQPPELLPRMQTDEIYNECIDAMQRLIEFFVETLRYRTDIFYTDELEYETENFARFGIIARSLGSAKQIFTSNLSGVSFSATLELTYKDNCKCPPIIPAPIPPDPFTRTLSTGEDRTVSTSETRTVST